MRSAIGPWRASAKCFVGLLVAALLEGLATEQEAGEPVGGIVLDEILGKLDRAVPMGRGRLEQEGLLENDLVPGVLGQRPGIELGSGGKVMVAASHAAGKIVAEKRAAIAAVVRTDLRIGGGRGDKKQRNNKQPPCPPAQSRTLHDCHFASAVSRPVVPAMPNQG